MIPTMPVAEQAERIVLGSILRGNSTVDEISRTLQPEDFGLEQHRRIFLRAMEVSRAGEEVNGATVYHALERHKQHDGALSYLAELGEAGFLPRVDSYVRAIRDHSIRRRAITHAEKLSGLAQAGAPTDEITSAATSLAADLSSTQSSDERHFTALGDDRYRLEIPGVGVIEVDRLRRDRNELQGELAVWRNTHGKRTIDTTLSIGDFNLSSVRARSDRAKLLADRSKTNGAVDWAGLLEEFCQRVLAAERQGNPAVDLRELPRPAADDMIRIEGLAFPRRHVSILFGDGGAAKSYLALWLLGRLAQRGARVALFDWELAGDDHRERLERLFGDDMPRITYVHCERPLTAEADRLRRIVRDEGIEYAVYDSIAFACDGPPEAAEVAGRYFRAVRSIGIGGLHVAHVSKAEDADKKPFGSAFWHNGARATWYAKRSNSDDSDLSLGLFNRKSNLGPLQQPLGFTIRFSEERTTILRANVADSPDLAAKLSVPQQMAYLLRRGPMTAEALAEETGAEIQTIRRNVRRYKDRFIVADTGRIALLERERQCD